MEKHLASTKPGNFKQTDRYASQLSMLANRNEHQIIEDVDLINEDIQNCKLKDKKHICTRKTISAYNWKLDSHEAFSYNRYSLLKTN